VHFPEQEVLYLADVDMSRFGPWYGDEGSDIDRFLASIEVAAGIPARHYVPSHGRPLEDVAGPAAAYRQVIFDRDERILEALKVPLGLEELTDRWIVYGRRRSPEMFYRYSERAMVRKHLERLAARGMIAEEDGKFVRAS
ncbi:MAG: MBL fold metallo-hydrolase, partial [bacterium]